MSRPRQRRGVTYSCVHLEFYPIIIFYEIVREIEPLLGIVQMFTHVGNLIELYSAASPAFYIILLVSYYQTVPCFPFKALCPHTGDFPRGVGHRVKNGRGLTKVDVVLLNGVLW